MPAKVSVDGALQEASEIFGDPNRLIQQRRLTQALGSNEPKTSEDLELLEKNRRILKTDEPERSQVLFDHAILVCDFKEESSWILDRLPAVWSIKDDEIQKFLECQHLEKLDIPYIATFKKLFKDEDDNDQQKWRKVHWAIQGLDQKWLLLQNRKNALKKHYKARYEQEQTNQRCGKILASIIKSLEAVKSEQEIDDVTAKFNLHFPQGQVTGQYKRPPTRKSGLSPSIKSGLWEVASKFGCSAEQLGLQLSQTEIQVEKLEDATGAPEEMASNHITAMFKTPDAVLEQGRHMAALEISCEPYVRKYVRAAYMENAVVSTSPTSNGNVTIDAFPEFFRVKSLREKPVCQFEDAQWLLIEKAEEKKVLQVTLKLPEKRMDQLMTECKKHYLSHGDSKSAKLWNEQRQLILQNALFGFLMPSMEKEARSLLTSRAKRSLLWDYGQVLWKKLSVCPYPRKKNEPSSDAEAAPRVMACRWGEYTTTIVMLDSVGEVLGVLEIGSLTLRSQNVNDQKRKTDNQQLVLEFMKRHQPHVVALEADDFSSTKLKKDIYEIISKMVEKNPRDVGELSIQYVDESLPRLYVHSQIFSDQQPSLSGTVKKAVALGRYLQNPLAMAATLCGPQRDILSWKLHSLENLLTDDEKYAMVEQVMVDVTNQVGFDVNLAICSKWLFAPLQFISGLGPRKAAFLQRSLLRAGEISTRTDFHTVHGLGEKVLLNADGFLRVRPSGLVASSSQLIDLSDDLRKPRST